MMETNFPAFEKTIAISATLQTVWDALTVPNQMQQWMSEMDIEIVTDWKVGNPITIQGQMYKKPFVNYGTVTAFQPQNMVEYTHRSSLSRLPDEPESYVVLRFELTNTGDSTTVHFKMHNFPTEAIYKHLVFYWNVGLELLKRFAEKG